jgi:hypothetical protein
MPGPIQLGGGAQPSRAGTDYRYFFAGANLRQFGDDPTRFPPFINDGAFEGLDRDRRSIDAQDARTFARRGTDPAREVGKVIRLMKPFQGLLPETAVNEVIPFRNEIMDRATRCHPADQTAGMTERNAAIHAARGLVAELVLLHVEVEFIPVADAFDSRPVKRQFA